MREPEGVRPFFDSYFHHPPGMPHELVVLTKGHRCILPVDVATIEHRELFRGDRSTDLQAYRWAHDQLSDMTHLCFLNSYSVIQADNWLAFLLNAMIKFDAALVGSSWSLESFYTNHPAKWRLKFFAPFPNFHIRTTGFLITSGAMEHFWPRWIPTKWNAYLFESGRNSLTRRLTRAGLRVVAINAQGDIRTQDFRARQENLLITDNQTCRFDRAKSRKRSALAKAAWGNQKPCH